MSPLCERCQDSRIIYWAPAHTAPCPECAAPQAAWEAQLEAEENGEEPLLPRMRYDGLGYRWRRLRFRLWWLRYGFHMAFERNMAPWVGAKEVPTDDR